jgi:phosphate transport system protein
VPRSYYIHELQQLRDDVLIMASMVYQQVTDSVTALRTADLDLARRIISQDVEINRRRFSLEDDALTIIATQAPMAGDMRFLAGTLEVISELERIGDYGKGIGRITLMLGRDSGLRMPAQLDEMCELALAMLRKSIDAFVAGDVNTASAIPPQDDTVDQLYNMTNIELVRMVVAEPQKMPLVNLFSWAAHNIERTADRATNICERTLYMVTGEMRELDHAEQEFSGLT